MRARTLEEVAELTDSQMMMIDMKAANNLAVCLSSFFVWNISAKHSWELQKWQGRYQAQRKSPLEVSSGDGLNQGLLSLNER